jgi:hypothetical protein
MLGGFSTKTVTREKSAGQQITDKNWLQIEGTEIGVLKEPTYLE